MASNWPEENEDVNQQESIETETSTYDQLWKEALDVDDEVQRILREHAITVEPAEEITEGQDEIK